LQDKRRKIQANIANVNFLEGSIAEKIAVIDELRDRENLILEQLSMASEDTSAVFERYLFYKDFQ